jgi:hypothetical protein
VVANAKRKRSEQSKIVPPPPYTQEYLETLTVEIIRNQILMPYSIRNGRNKKHTIRLILERFAPHQQTLAEQTLESIDSTQHLSPSKITQHYKKYFNPIDRHNRWWYQHAYSYPNHKWRSKMVISVGDMAIVNTYVLFNDFKILDYTNFRKQLGRALMEE